MPPVGDNAAAAANPIAAARAARIKEQRAADNGDERSLADMAEDAQDVLALMEAVNVQANVITALTERCDQNDAAREEWAGELGTLAAQVGSLETLCKELRGYHDGNEERISALEAAPEPDAAD